MSNQEVSLEIGKIEQEKKLNEIERFVSEFNEQLDGVFEVFEYFKNIFKRDVLSSKTEINDFLLAFYYASQKFDLRNQEFLLTLEYRLNSLKEILNNFKDYFFSFGLSKYLTYQSRKKFLNDLQNIINLIEIYIEKIKIFFNSNQNESVDFKQKEKVEEFNKDFIYFFIQLNGLLEDFRSNNIFYINEARNVYYKISAGEIVKLDERFRIANNKSEYAGVMVLDEKGRSVEATDRLKEVGMSNSFVEYFDLVPKNFVLIYWQQPRAKDGSQSSSRIKFVVKGTRRLSQEQLQAIHQLEEQLGLENNFFGLDEALSEYRKPLINELIVFIRENFLKRINFLDISKIDLNYFTLSSDDGLLVNSDALILYNISELNLDDDNQKVFEYKLPKKLYLKSTFRIIVKKDTNGVYYVKLVLD